MVSIADFERGRMLSLMPNKKEAMIFELKGKMSEDKIRKSNFFGNLPLHAGRLSPGGSKGTARRTGRERTRRATRLRFSHRVDRPGANVVGGRRHGPAGEAESTQMGPPKTEAVMSDFEFDKPLDQSLFSVEPPADYKSFTVPIDTAPPSEEDLIASLRNLTNALDGEFPSALDTPGIARTFAKLLKGKENSEAMMTEGVTIGRGLQFAMLLPVDADAHYAGKGVKRDGPHRADFLVSPGRYEPIPRDLQRSDCRSRGQSAPRCRARFAWWIS